MIVCSLCSVLFSFLSSLFWFFRLKRLWNFFSNSGSLWVAWISSNRFNGKSYWLVNDSQRFSATIRGMLQLKHLLPQFLRCTVGDGRNASFWFDYWTEFGPLFEMFGPTGTRQLRIPLEASVAMTVMNGGWFFPPARSDNAVTLQVVLSATRVPSPLHPTVMMFIVGEETLVAMFLSSPLR